MNTHSEAVEPIQPEVLARLAARAKETSETVNGLLQKMLDEMESASTNDEPDASMTPQEKAEAWREWTTKHAVSLPCLADDSRESIYTREDEAL